MMMEGEHNIRRKFTFQIQLYSITLLASVDAGLGEIKKGLHSATRTKDDDGGGMHYAAVGTASASENTCLAFCASIRLNQLQMCVFCRTRSASILFA